MPGALRVALRKESVDRNIQHAPNMPGVSLSLSARRAWIEIQWHPCTPTITASLSARRAWIEIQLIETEVIRSEIESLSARRAWIEINWVMRLSWSVFGRSPQGERG